MANETVISRRLIKKVMLGPRQMTFGFENQVSHHMDLVFSSVEKVYQKGGPVRLDHLTSLPAFAEKMSVMDLLQAVFWLAEELKVHFFIDSHISPPLQTKKILVENPERAVFVVINKPMDTAMFKQACEIGRSVLPSLPENIDQYAFSRHIVNTLKTWLERLVSYAPLAEQPFFPGRKEIKNNTVLLKKMLEKQDSHSIISAVLKYRTRMNQLAEAVEKLTGFYNHNQAFWQVLVEQMENFEVNLAEIQKNQEIFSKYTRLTEIMKSSHPYPMVTEAKGLLILVQDFHRKVEQEKVKILRADTMVKIDKMVQKLRSLFDTFDSDQEYRNHCLYQLRNLNNQIENSDGVEKINQLFNDAKDLFVDVIEEI